MDSHKPHDDDRNSASLGSAEYRSKLLTKLNCLMAVLEVAITKITRSMELPTANQERLSKIKANLENTLAICTRAKETLEKTINRSSTPAPRTETKPAATEAGSMSYRDYVELSSIEEYQKFKNLPPINESELQSSDIDDLLRKLYES